MTDRRLPPLYPLRAFEAVSRRLSFTLAAEELSISQSAVSHQVKSLEAYFGVLLFHRSPGSLRLTAEGKRLFSACESAFAQLSQIRDHLPESEMRGTLTLSSPPLIFNWWLLPHLREFAKQYPNVRFRILHSVCGDRVMTTDTDIAMLWDTKIAEGFFGTKMFEMAYGPVASPRLAAELPEYFTTEILEKTVLLHENDHTVWSSWFAQAGFPDVAATSGWVFEDPGMMIEAAAAGQGVALAPFPLIDELVNSGRLVRIFGHSITSENNYFLCVSNRSLEKPVVRLFWNWFSQYGLPSFSELAAKK
jgi:LysR family transcriptional regulator, glycine cleavage system transcriptional activator